MKSEKKPIYKKWWFIGLIAFLLIGFAGSFLPDTELTEGEISKTEQEGQINKEDASELEKSELEADLTVDIAQNEKIDKEEQKAIEIAMKEFGCGEEELYVEILKDKSYQVNLVTYGVETMSTVDSLLIVKGKIKAHMYDENSTVEAFWTKVDEESADSKADSEKKRINPLNAKWNVKDTNIITNGNLKVAGDILDKMSNEDIENAAWVLDFPINVYQAPWKYYGHIMTIEGTVLNKIIYPPGSDMSEIVAKGKTCSEINILSQDESFTITFIFIGDSSSIQIDDYVTAHGLPVGHVETENFFGGQGTGLVVVGIQK